MLGGQVGDWDGFVTDFCSWCLSFRTIVCNCVYARPMKDRAEGLEEGRLKEDHKVDFLFLDLGL